MTTTGCDTCRISSRNLSGVMWLSDILRKLRGVFWGGASVNPVPASFVFGDAGSKGACVDDFVSAMVPAAVFNDSICTTAGVTTFWRAPTDMMAFRQTPLRPTGVLAAHEAVQKLFILCLNKSEDRRKRPYLFTQLVQLSDGSTYTMRTTSPYALYKSTKDTRNHLMWNPSAKELKNVEVDEAGKLAAFRGRFGRSWDLPAGAEEEGEAGGNAAEGTKKVVDEDAFSLDDLVSRYAIPVKDEKPKSEKGKK
ncbi:hypothetical protein SCAR479_02801 [Seiridium cardinale]|uniref:Ribosomal protein bL31m N-terminal domain-containing protein n=1 Tax=Seiridium cardinale TaxID=138064 RepID=A0ABR2Y2E4_9PEZI